jgi:hypothetical protein
MDKTMEIDMHTDRDMEKNMDTNMNIDKNLDIFEIQSDKELP